MSLSNSRIAASLSRTGYGLSLSTAATVLLLASSASAWTGPTSAPPNGNASAPVNVSATAQTKSGNLTVSGVTTIGNGLYNSVAPGTVLDANGAWVRTYGAGGWYNQTYAGGWYMADTTWIRSYGSKYVYMSPGFDTSGASGVGCGGGIGAGYMLRVCGSFNSTGATYATGGIYDGTTGLWTSQLRLTQQLGPATTFNYTADGQCPSGWVMTGMNQNYYYGNDGGGSPIYYPNGYNVTCRQIYY